MAISELQGFLRNLTRFGLEYFRLYYGPFRAQVQSNKDPEGLGRIIVDCPRARFPPQNANWVLPMMSGAGPSQGVFWPPEIGTYVWIFFDNGNPLVPACYLGGWYGPEELHDDFSPEEDGTPNRRGLQTPGGHKVILDDTEGLERITIRHKDGSIVQWKENGKVRIGNEDGSFEPMMRGSTVKSYLESHTHPHSFGSTGKPILPFPADGLSDDTETS